MFLFVLDLAGLEIIFFMLASKGIPQMYCEALIIKDIILYYNK